jgi:hypothetical protein
VQRYRTFSPPAERLVAFQDLLMPDTWLAMDCWQPSGLGFFRAAQLPESLRRNSYRSRSLEIDH